MKSYFYQVGSIIELCRNKRLGNSLLYEICKNEKSHEWNNSFILADKIWLIGRAYAASVERRYFWNKTGDWKPNNLDELVSGDGTCDFFALYSDIMLNNELYKVVIDLAKGLKPLKFDKSKDDIEQLKRSVNLVLTLNNLCVESAKAYDEKINSTLVDKMKFRNHLSFASKFAHFHCPYNVFIFDHFTEDGGKTLFSMRRRGWVFNDSVLITKEMQDLFISSKNSCASENIYNGKEEVIKRYASHVLNEYILCCEIKKELNDEMNEEEYPYYTRLADAVCQRIKKSVVSDTVTINELEENEVKEKMCDILVVNYEDAGVLLDSLRRSNLPIDVYSEKHNIVSTTPNNALGLIVCLNNITFNITKIFFETLSFLLGLLPFGNLFSSIELIKNCRDAINQLSEIEMTLYIYLKERSKNRNALITLGDLTNALVGVSKKGKFSNNDELLKVLQQMIKKNLVEYDISTGVITLVE